MKFIDLLPKSKWKFFLLVVLSILVSLLIGGGLVLIENTKSATSTWQTYRNEEFGFEVEYPKAWKVQETSPGVLELKNPEEQIHISIRSFDASVRGISYCEAHPYDIPRCEQNVVDGFYGTIDWQVSENEANALFDDMSITLDVRPPTRIDSAIKAFV